MIIQSLKLLSQRLVLLDSSKFTFLIICILSIHCSTYAQDIDQKDLELSHQELDSTIFKAFDQNDLDKAIYYATVGRIKTGVQDSVFVNYTDDLADAYKLSGQYEKALETYTESKEIRAKILGEDHPYFAASLNNIGGIYDKMDRPEDALPLYLKAKDIYEKHQDEYSKAFAKTLSDIGSSYTELYEYEKALPFLQKGLQVTEKTLGKENKQYAEVLSRLGYYYEMVGDYETALSTYMQAKSIYEKKGNKHQLKLAKTLDNIAYVYGSLGEYSTALSFCLQAKNIQEISLGITHPDLASTLHHLANLYTNLGEYEKALPLHIQAKNINENIFGKDHATFAGSLKELALLYERIGDYEKALPLYIQCKGIFQKTIGKNNNSFTNLLNNLAYLYKSMGQYKKSLSCYTECKNIREKLFGKDHTYLATTLNNLASLYQDMGEYEKALEYYLEVKRIDEKTLGKDHPYFSSTLNNLASLYQDMGEYEKALPFYIESYKIAKQSLGDKHLSSIQSLNSLASSYYDLGDTSQAWQYMNQALSLISDLEIEHNFDTEWLEKIQTVTFPSNGHIGTILTILDNSYEFLRKESSNTMIEQQLVIIEFATDLIEKARNETSDEQDKLRWLTKNDTWLQRSLSILTPQSDGQKAFELAEGNKSILLLQATQSEVIYKMGELPDSLIREDKNLQKQHSQLKAKLFELRSKQEKDSLRNELNKTNQLIDEFTNMLKKEFPKYYDLKNQAISIQADKIQTLLEDKTMLIEYVISDSFVHIFSIEKTQLQWIQQKIDHKELTTNIKQYHNILSNYILLNNDPKTSYQQYTQLAHWFYQNMIAPALKNQKNIENLIIVTDGELGHLPFETFLVEAAPQEETAYSQLNYLLNQYNISYNYSAALWKQNIEAMSTNNNGQIFGMAANYNIQLDMSISGDRIVSDTLIRNQLEALPNARKEVETLEANFKGFFAYDTLASERTLKKTVGDYAIIHLATHGLLNKRRPMLSSIALTEDSDSVENNFWQAHEISKLDLNADLVILSACETGYGKFERGNGIASLARAFMYAGSPSLIVSLWKVNDASTSRIMQNIYENLADKLPKDKALRQAKLKYIQNATGNAAHPAFWSPFIQIGNTDPVTIQRKDSDGISWWMLAGAGIFIFLGIGILMKRQRKNETT